MHTFSYAIHAFVAGKEHWLGLKNLHTMTKAKIYQLRIRLVDTKGKVGFGFYNSFRIMTVEFLLPETSVLGLT